MDKGEPVPEKFLEVATGFVLVSVDTRNGSAPETQRLHVGRNDAYFLFLDSNGREFYRMVDPGNLALRYIRWDAAIEQMRKALEKPPVGKEGIALLRSLLTSDVAYLRTSTLYRLTCLGEAAAPLVPELLKLLDDKAVAHQAIAALGAIGPKARAAAPLLVKRLDQGAPHGQAALIALGKIDRGGGIAVSVLVRYLDKRNQTFAIGAAIGLGHLGAKAVPAVDALIALLETKVDSVRYHAIQALGRIGPAAAAATEALDVIAKAPWSKPWDTRSAAREALKRIRK